MKNHFIEKKILITGGAGFIGSNLVEAFLNTGAKVRVFDNFSTGNEENLRAMREHPNLITQAGDICELNQCQKACEGVDYVLHHAALGSVPRSLKDPLKTHDVNVNGTLNMLMAARDQGVKRFVYASSSSVYGDSPILPKKEGQEGVLLSPYAVTKAVNELYANNFHKVYRLPTIGLRYFNVFGKNQDPHSQYAAVIPLFIKSLLDNRSPKIFGDGKQSRDFTYIDNVIEANMKACLADPKAFGEVFNIGCSEQHYLIDIYREIQTLMSIDIPPIYEAERLGDIKHSHADIEHAKDLLGYSPQVKVKEGLMRAIEWYRQNL